MTKSRKILSAKRKETIEQTALLVLDDYYPGDDLIKPEVIARGEKITYSANDYNNDFKGLIQCINWKFHIYLDVRRGENLNSGNVRFSFAHELGHYFINEHRFALMNEGILPKVASDPMLTDDIFEKEAEYFASCLLLPKDNFHQDIVETEFRFDLIIHLSSKYRVSLTAVLLRYLVLGEIPIAVICSRDTRYLWHRTSKGFPFYRLNLEAETQIPHGSRAGDYFYEGKREFKISKLMPASLWFLSASKDELIRTFKEHCFRHQATNQVISVIWEMK